MPLPPAGLGCLIVFVATAALPLRRRSSRRHAEALAPCRGRGRSTSPSPTPRRKSRGRADPKVSAEPGVDLKLAVSRGASPWRWP